MSWRLFNGGKSFSMPQVCVAIVGGRLQGMEATYLCSNADVATILMDRDPNPPAKGLCDEFFRVDVVKEPMKAKHVLKRCDAVLPANENRRALPILQQLCHELEIPLMQDNEAFWITSDKRKSMRFLRKSRIPTPEAWPRSGFPVIVKPSSRSGSESVYRADNKGQLKKMLTIVRRIDSNPIVQEFIQGAALSLEVVSRKGVGRPIQITGLEFDETYGCKRVYAPVELSSRVEERMKSIGSKLALNLGLNGLTDVQALLKGLTPRVNDVNARLPSQTPSVVYHSTKVNMAELLIGLFLHDKLLPTSTHSQRAVVYQHVRIRGKELRVQGEHVMAEASRLRVKKGFLGADEAITNLEPGADANNRVATLITKSRDLASASKKMKDVIVNIAKEWCLDHYADPSPVGGY
jgi:pyrrolysine biosynthesis protein PylC